MSNANERRCSFHCDTEGEFSVYQEFVDGSNEPLKRFVGIEESMPMAVRFTKSVGARIGTTRRVIITDGGDCCVWEWKFGEGIVFSPELVGRLK